MRFLGMSFASFARVAWVVCASTLVVHCGSNEMPATRRAPVAPRPTAPRFAPADARVSRLFGDGWFTCARLDREVECWGPAKGEPELAHVRLHKRFGVVQGVAGFVYASVHRNGVSMTPVTELDGINRLVASGYVELPEWVHVDRVELGNASGLASTDRGVYGFKWTGRGTSSFRASSFTTCPLDLGLRLQAAVGTCPYVVVGSGRAFRLTDDALFASECPAGSPESWIELRLATGAPIVNAVCSTAAACTVANDGSLSCFDAENHEHRIEGLPSAAIVELDVTGDEACALLANREVYCFDAAGGTPEKRAEDVDHINRGKTELCVSRGTRITCEGDDGASRLLRP